MIDYVSAIIIGAVLLISGIILTRIVTYNPLILLGYALVVIGAIFLIIGFIIFAR